MWYEFLFPDNPERKSPQLGCRVNGFCPLAVPRVGNSRPKLQLVTLPPLGFLRVLVHEDHQIIREIHVKVYRCFPELIESLPLFLARMAAASLNRVWMFCRQSRHFMNVLLNFLISGSLIALAFPSTMGQGTDPVELKALFEVINGINSDTDWKARLSDPCVMGNQQGIYCLPDDFTGKYHVTNLEFGFVSEYDNLITCSDDAVLHPSIAKLPFLQTLFIFNCFENGTATIPKEIGQLSSSLQMLTLQGNAKLGGTLPVEIGNLTSLQRLVLTENSLGGVIPAEIGNLRSLLQLDLSENCFHGAIPASISSLQSLVILDLGENLLSGNLPSLCGLGDLEQMVVSNNDLSGIIPEDFGKLSSLTYLDLSRNCLWGGIPSSFGNLTKLEDLFLESNNMQSPLPEFVGGMSGLLRLSLSESGYVGEIPQSLGGLSNLRVLLLHGNEFSGYIPSTIGALQHIVQLDLSANHLTGPVPFSPAFVKKLGTNLLVWNNSGLCIPPRAEIQEAAASMGVGTCGENTSSSIAGREAGPPSLLSAAVSEGIIHSSDASGPFGKLTCVRFTLLFVLSVWTLVDILDELAMLVRNQFHRKMDTHILV